MIHKTKGLAVLLAMLVTAATLVTGIGSAQAGQQSRVVAKCTHLAVKPRKIVVTCADGGIYVVVHRYRSWTRTGARGSGVYWRNDCTPSCAGGTFHHHRAHIRLGRVVTTRRGPVFSRLHVRFLAHHKVHRVSYPLPTRPLG